EGIRFTTSYDSQGVATFYIPGDLEIGPDTITIVGSRPAALVVGDNVAIDPNAVIDASAVGAISGPGGGQTGFVGSGGWAGSGGPVGVSSVPGGQYGGDYTNGSPNQSPQLGAGGNGGHGGYDPLQFSPNPAVSRPGAGGSAGIDGNNGDVGSSGG